MRVEPRQPVVSKFVNKLLLNVKQIVASILLSVLFVVTCSVSINSSSSSGYSLYPIYDHYTVSEGKMAWACLAILDFKSLEYFQKVEGLDQDGVVGPNTWSSLRSRLQEKGIEVITSLESPIQIQLEHKEGNIILVIASTKQVKQAQLIIKRKSGFTLIAKIFGRKVDGKLYRSSIRKKVLFEEKQELKSHSIAFDYVEQSYQGSTLIQATAIVSYNNRIYYVESDLLTLPFPIDELTETSKARN